MEATDIARITYELVRIRDDRQLMAWEDDRATLLREIDALHRKLQKDREVARGLYRELDEVKSLVYSKIRSRKNPNRNEERIPITDAADAFSTEDQPRNLLDASPIVKRQKLDTPSSSSCSPVHCSSAPPAAELDREHKLSPSTNRRSVEYSKGSKTVSVAGTSRVRTAGGNKVEVTEQVVKFVDNTGANRRKAVRDCLPGHVCIRCDNYFAALRQQGIIVDDKVMQETLLNCSRHKARHSPPHTPVGFWDCTVQTPEDWK